MTGVCAHVCVHACLQDGAERGVVREAGKEEVEKRDGTRQNLPFLEADSMK